MLRGKHKPIFAPHIDTGDHVIIVNADKVVLTSGKAEQGGRTATRGYPGGLKRETYADLLARKPAEAVRQSVRGMLPKGPLGRQMLQQAEGLRRARRTRTPPSSPRSSRSPTPRRGSDEPQRARFTCPSRSSRPPVAARRPSPACASAPARARSPSTGGRSSDYFPIRDAPDDRSPSRCGSRRPTRSTTSTPRSTAAASPARPARCASASPGRSSSSTPSCGPR